MAAPDRPGRMNVKFFFVVLVALLFVSQCMCKYPILLLEKIEDDQFRVACVNSEENDNSSTVVWVPSDSSNVLEDDIVKPESLPEIIRSRSIEYNLPPVLDHRWNEFSSLISNDTTHPYLLENVENTNISVINFSVSYKKCVTIILDFKDQKFFATICENDEKVEFMATRSMITKKSEQTYALWRHYKIYKSTDDKFYVENSLSFNPSFKYNTFKLYKLQVISNEMAKWKIHDFKLKVSPILSKSHLYYNTDPGHTCISSFTFLEEGCEALASLCNNDVCSVVYASQSIKESFKWMEINLNSKLPENVSHVYVHFEVSQHSTNAKECSLAFLSEFRRCSHSGNSMSHRWLNAYKTDFTVTKNKLKTKDVTGACQNIKELTNLSFYAPPISNDVNQLDILKRFPPTKQVMCYSDKCQCSSGYDGDWCLNLCRRGFWGYNCKMTCPQCRNDNCFPESGNCSDGCKLISNRTDCKVPQPHSPINLTATIATNNTINLRWIYPNIQEAQIQHFTIKIFEGNERKILEPRTSEVQQNYTQNNFEYLMSDLMPSTKYEFSVVATNVNPGNESELFKIATYPKKPVIHGDAKVDCDSDGCSLILPKIEEIDATSIFYLTTNRNFEEPKKNSGLLDYNNEHRSIVFQRSTSKTERISIENNELIEKCKDATSQCDLSLVIGSSYEGKMIYARSSVQINIDKTSSIGLIWMVSIITIVIVIVIIGLIFFCFRKTNTKDTSPENIPLYEVTSVNIEETLKELVSTDRKPSLQKEYESVQPRKITKQKILAQLRKSSYKMISMKSMKKAKFSPSELDASFFVSLFPESEIKVFCENLPNCEYKVISKKDSTDFVELNWTTSTTTTTTSTTSTKTVLINFNSWPNKKVPNCPYSFYNFLRFMKENGVNKVNCIFIYSNNIEQVAALILYNELFVQATNSSFKIVEFLKDFKLRMTMQQYIFCYFILDQKRSNFTLTKTREDYLAHYQAFLQRETIGNFNYFNGRRYIFEKIYQDNVDNTSKWNRTNSAQIPLQNNIDSFWDKICTSNVEQVLILQRENEDINYFWPKISNNIARITKISFPRYCVDLKYSNPENTKKCKKVEVLHLMNSPERIFYEFHNAMSDSKKLFVCCSDGKTLCGPFIAYDYVIRKFKSDKLIDIQSAVFRTKLCNSDFFTDKAHYDTLYNAVDYYLKQKNT